MSGSTVENDKAVAQVLFIKVKRRSRSDVDTDTDLTDVTLVSDDTSKRL